MSREFIYFVFFPVKKIKICEFVRCEDKGKLNFPVI